MFPVQHFDWQATIKINIYMLQLVGLWPKGAKRYKPDCYQFYATTYTLLLMSSNSFFQIINVFFVYQDLEALANTIFITCTAVMVAVKMYFFIQKVGLLKELMDILGTDLFQPISEKQVELVKPDLKFWKIFYVGYWFVVGTTVLFWCLFPFLNNSVKDKQLPFMAWYPYNAKVSPWYEFTYFYQVATFGYVTPVGTNMDTLMAALMMYIGAQCDILCDKLRNLKILATESDTNVNGVIIHCVQHHRQIIHFAEIFNKFLNMIILGQFCTSTTVITLTMFQLSLVDPWSEEGFSHLFYVSAVTSQIFLYCWFGNQVEVKVST
ncbi:hypothetical protein Zmor_007610 [Zophobas morio]|uniref:7tm 6 domain containing protein n=1 Tax=Zophobas morio TaxID=2755281 RepID=A0AA38J2B3_9CUCU|nr:hypothetical protein Zmor_007610 [Zophobas morio]